MPEDLIRLGVGLLLFVTALVLGGLIADRAAHNEHLRRSQQRDREIARRAIALLTQQPYGVHHDDKD